MSIKPSARHVMIDLETMGKGPRAAIIAIGAVEFDPAQAPFFAARTFYQAVELQSSVDEGLEIDAETVLWWLQQSDAAREAITTPDATPLRLALYDFITFLGGSGLGQTTDDLIVWANGASFDFPILSTALHQVGMEQPWHYWNERDWRTLRKIAPPVSLPREGTSHNALDDALHQAQQLQLVWAAMNLGTESPATASLGPATFPCGSLGEEVAA